MLDKLLKHYKESYVFEVGDGFISACDGFTFATVFDKRFQGFPEGKVRNADLTRLIESESFGFGAEGLWVENGGKRELIKITPNRLLMLAHIFDEKAPGNPKFESKELVRAIKKTKVSDASYLGFEGSKATIFDFERNPIFELEVPMHFEKKLLYNWSRLKKGIKMKKESPVFSVAGFGSNIRTLRLYWKDFRLDIVNSDNFNLDIAPSADFLVIFNSKGA